MSYKIFTDTSANLPESFIYESGVEIIPFSYTVDNAPPLE